MAFDVYLEETAKRTFACAVDWPGWARSGKGADEALQALFDYGPRYAKALGRARSGFVAPDDPSQLKVVERLKGDASTDFGIPGVVPKLDRHSMPKAELERQIALLQSVWRKFDRAARAAHGKTLSKGPRGGGRTPAKIVEHVLGADQGYLSPMGAKYGGDPGSRAGIRAAVIEALWARQRGEPPPEWRRSKKPMWPPAYGLRRVAWHNLDHAWEIEDRS